MEHIKKEFVEANVEYMKKPYVSIPTTSFLDTGGIPPDADTRERISQEHVADLDITDIPTLSLPTARPHLPGLDSEPMTHATHQSFSEKITEDIRKNISDAAMPRGFEDNVKGFVNQENKGKSVFGGEDIRPRKNTAGAENVWGL